MSKLDVKHVPHGLLEEVNESFMQICSGLHYLATQITVIRTRHTLIWKWIYKNVSYIANKLNMREIDSKRFKTEGLIVGYPNLDITTYWSLQHNSLKPISERLHKYYLN